jgi:hypothetical protein
MELKRLLAILLACAALSPSPARAIGGVCLTCPQADFGRLTPTAAWQTHEAAIEPGGDCAWYAFDVTPGHRYDFATCSPGGAAFDTVLELMDASCGLLAINDNTCGNQSRITWVATAATVRLKVRGMGSGGSYALAYRDLGPACSDCGTPLGLLSPLPGIACNCLPGETTPNCPSAFFNVNMTAGVTCSITTCGASCAPATAAFDTVLKLRNSSCTTVLATNDDDCATPGFPRRSTLRYTPPSSGLYRLEVTGASAGAFGTFVVCHRSSSCVPAVVTLLPAGGDTEATSCSRNQDFALAVGPMAALPVTYAWSIVPPPGGSASRDRGTVTSSAPLGAATFRTRLTGAGTHAVHVVATNACGSAALDQGFILEDRSRPFLVGPPNATVECPDAPPVSSPRVRDNCDPSPALAMSETTTPGACPNASTVRREWTATDASGNVSATVRQVISVRDTRAPVVTPDLTTAHCVFPPDHGRACFTFTDFTPVAADACPGPLTWTFARITHDEEALGPCDPPDLVPDSEIAADGSAFCVRAERCNDDPLSSPGRLYLVEAVATDACGNTSPPTAIATILVPQDSADTTACRIPAPWE